MSNLNKTITESFTQYAGAVLQSRALLDVRDGLKPSARQIFYSMLLNKLTSDKPYKKTANAVGMAMADFYIHGDSSCEGVIMRAGQSFAMRYPLVDVKGNAGSLIESGNWAAMRYTESRLSKMSKLLFTDIDKDTISEWRDSYDNTKQYPAVLPSKGFYNLVNGGSGIGVGLACSIPQFNLRELNKALEILLLNPDCDFEDIYCAPDFATGATLLNENEVKISLKNGTGAACKLRSTIDFDRRENCFVVSEIPYAVYTNTICGELEAIINSEDNPGVDRFNDLTGQTPLIKIYLTKKANPDKVLRYLYKETSLQSYYGINLTMLDQGRYPRVFTWKEALQAHIDHEKEVYLLGYEFDLRKIEERLHIIEGLLICLASIDEVVAAIKASKSTQEARERLTKQFLLDDTQAKAVLDMKLSRLAHLEVEKLKSEKSKLDNERNFIYNIIRNDELFNAELVKGWREVSAKFGDERRTRILNISKDDEEPTETNELLINLSNKNNIYVTTVSTLYSQKRGGVGSKFKMSNGEFVISTASGTNHDTILLFSNIGNCYQISAAGLSYNEILSIHNFITLAHNEQIKQIVFLNKKEQKEHIVFFTKNGYIKKSKLSEYNIRKGTGIKALTLGEGDEISSILLLNDERVGMLTARGQFVMCETSSIRPIGRVARGVKGITLNSGDTLISACPISSSVKEILSVSAQGYIKRTALNEFAVTGRGTKGTRLHLLDGDDTMADFAPLINETETIVVTSKSQIKIRLNEIKLLSKGARGTKSIKISDAKVIGLQIF